MSDIPDIMAQMDQVDLSTVETSYPVLKTGIARFTISEFTAERDKPDKPPYFKVKYLLAEPYESQSLDGAPSKMIQPGFPVSERIYVQPWTDPKTGEVKNFGLTRVTQLREAVFGKAAPGTKFDPAELINQEITLKLKFNPAPKNDKTGQTYGPQTEVDGYIRKKS